MKKPKREREKSCQWFVMRDCETYSACGLPAAGVSSDDRALCTEHLQAYNDHKQTMRKVRTEFTSEGAKNND